MKRAIILVLDSFGIGAAEDAEKFSDQGSDTFGHIVEYCRDQRSKGPLQIPNLTRLGLIAAANASTGRTEPITNAGADLDGAYGYAVEISRGKDTPSGHWEMAGLPVQYDWGYFPPEYPSFPQALLDELIKRGNLPGVLGNKHASGTVIIEELGIEHIKTGKPIVYTSADSVFQIAAHEESFGLQRLYDLCDLARELVDDYNIGRVIARPFIGAEGNFSRTANRRDIATPPHAATLLDIMLENKGEVIAIGKIADIFAHRGISQTIKAENNMGFFDATLKAIPSAGDKTLIFTNFVDFDSHYGHRRNVEGYANALEEFDARIPELEALLEDDDIVIMTADHGCDPTWPGSDHTREHIPVIMFGPKVESGEIGRCASFADIGQTVADHLEMPNLDFGASFLQKFYQK